MKYRLKLFLTHKLYAPLATDALFVKAMRENVAYHARHCPAYKDILENFSFNLQELKGTEDLYKIPALPTSYLKNNSLHSKPYQKLLIKTTSSGTSGKTTKSGFDFGSAFCGLFMVLRIFRYYKLFSFRKTNYLLLGYPPQKEHQTAMAKALKGATWLAPAGKVIYALQREKGAYRFALEEMAQALQQFAAARQPVRIIGFPAYFKMLANYFSQKGIQLALNKHSKVLLGGGWKAMFTEEISKSELFDMAEKVFGIKRNNCFDHFSTAEHPIDYITCNNGHYHVPAYSRVLIRDVKTLAPLPYGEAGILNLLTPLLSGTPYGSILTDDIAVLQAGGECGCGIQAPYFQLLGRVGLNLKTCAQAASELLKSL